MDIERLAREAGMHEDCGRWYSPTSDLLREFDVSTDHLRKFAALIAEECAKVCEARRDLREEARAALKVATALKEGTEEDMLARLRHESTVRFFNSTIDQCAAAIREAVK